MMSIIVGDCKVKKGDEEDVKVGIMSRVLPVIKVGHLKFLTPGKYVNLSTFLGRRFGVYFAIQLLKSLSAIEIEPEAERELEWLMEGARPYTLKGNDWLKQEVIHNWISGFWAVIEEYLPEGTVDGSLLPWPAIQQLLKIGPEMRIY